MLGWIEGIVFLSAWIGWLIYSERRKWSITIGIGGGIFVAGALSLVGVPIIGSILGIGARAAMTAPVAIPVQVIYNNSWDGSVQQVEHWIKKNINDADSFKADEWSPVIKVDDGFIVRCRFRAKNAYGAYMLSNAVFKLDLQGNVVNVSCLN